MKNLLAVLLLLVFNAPGEAETLFDKLATRDAAPYTIIGSGFVTDDSHPMHPGYFRKYDVTIRLSTNPELGETAIAFEWTDETKTNTDNYYVRRGRLFQLDDKGQEKEPESLGDLSPATIAATHPGIVINAILERRENVEPDHADGYLFAWSDELWSLAINDRSGRVNSLHRRVHHDVHGDATENIHYDGQNSSEEANYPARVSVSLGGREIAHFEFGSAVRGAEFAMPDQERFLDHNRVISESEIKFTKLAPHVFCTELASINTRVFVAEFMDFLVVLEGAYNSRNCDKIVTKVQEHFKKPVKYFAFSHLHGQYVGGTRSWVAAGATVIVPTTTVKLIEEMVNTSNDLEPDALTRAPKPLQIAAVKEGRRIDDETNALEIYNVESDHTDEYFIFYFPRQKLLLTGDLLFYRSGQPLKGRSKKLCETIQKLGLDVETYVCTWPLTGYDTKNIVSRAEMLEACNQKN